MSKIKRKTHRGKLRADLDSHFENLFDRHVNFKERIIYINDDIDEWSLDLFQKAFDELESSSSDPIRVEISSYGGSVYDMLGMIDRMRYSKCKVYTAGRGKIFSAATFLLSAGDYRIIGENSWYMIHEISTWAAGKTSDLKIEMKHLEKLEDQACKLYESLSNQKTSALTFRKLLSRDCYLSASEVLKLGLVDEIAKSAKKE